MIDVEINSVINGLQLMLGQYNGKRSYEGYPKALRDGIATLRALSAADQTTALDAIVAKARADGMRKAAGICTEQSEIFETTEYATGQPLSSFVERFACKACETAILAAIPKGGAE